ncbi:hypothetical protein HK100_006333 [Physocladia obscura]|uniref:Ketoreductase domain-containing protein n=1 Tax=Physocladia obscura TaxID=109957 RepID=A0AAD5T5U9_9FUNG|nr:hypothetical protein HK100_006333 [Physocladia obscura]
MAYQTSAPLVLLQTDLQGKVALITGASRGIGRAIAIKFASLGAKIAVNYVTDKTAATQVVEEVTRLGSEAIAVQGNVALETDATRIVATTIDHFGRIDVLVNNAAAGNYDPLVETTTETFRTVMGVSVDGTFFVTRAAVPHIQENGTIINLSSNVTKTPYSGFSVYTMAKAAVEGFTRALAVELGSRKIRVNTITPGMTATDMSRGLGEAALAAGAENSLFKRLGTPEDIAETAAFLAVPRSGAWVTGANILSNGGLGGFSI